MSSPRPGSAPRRPRPSIATWVAGVTLLSLLPLLLFSALAIHRQLAAEQARSLEALQRRASVAAAALGHELASVQSLLDAMGVGIAAQTGDLAAMHAMATRVVGADRRLSSISLSDEQGRQWFTTARSFGAPLPDSNIAALLKDVFEHGTKWVSPLVTGAVSGQRVLGVAVPVEVHGRGRMALRAVVDLGAIGARLNEQQWPQDWVAAVLDQNRVIVARSRDAPRYVGQPATESLMAGLRSGQATFEAGTKDGIPTVVGVAAVPGSGWVVVAGRPLAALNAQVRESMVLVLLGGAICAVLGIGGAVFFSRHLGRQLRQVADAQAFDAETTGERSGIREVAELAQALAQARATATRAQREVVGRLEERSEMLDVLAHEVRQPLNNASAALQGATAALGDGGGASVVDAVVRAERVLSEVRSSIDNTLAMASLLVQGERVWERDTDIDSLVAVAIGDLPGAEAGRVCIERATSTRTASMDAGLMRLALRNLLSNALKFSPPGSPVTVRISDSDEPLALILDVIDEGPGIEPELLPRLFERDERRPKTASGKRQGLGLYIVRRVMDLHRGSVRVERTGPQGTTMRLVIEQSLDD
jgi:signal transduction histidine kinase